MPKRRYALVEVKGTAKRTRTVTIVAKGSKAHLKKAAEKFRATHPKTKDSKLRIAKKPIFNWVK